MWVNSIVKERRGSWRRRGTNLRNGSGDERDQQQQREGEKQTEGGEMNVIEEGWEDSMEGPMFAWLPER